MGQGANVGRHEGVWAVMSYQQPVTGKRGWYGGFVTDGQPSLSAALADMALGLASWRIWFTLAWNDIRQKYRGSILGPLWVTLSMAAFTGGIAVVYAAIFKIDVHAYMPHVAIGMVTWTLITGLVSETCTALVAAEGYLRQVRLPLSVFVNRVVARNALILVHHLLIVVVVAIWFDLAVTPVGAVLAIAGLLLLLLGGYGWGLFLACVCMRFRDVAQIVNTILTGAFFITPVLWKGDFLDSSHPALRYNPFQYMVEIVRQPLETGHVSVLNWLVVGGIAVAGLVLGLLVFRASRPRVTYWI